MYVIKQGRHIVRNQNFTVCNFQFMKFVRRFKNVSSCVTIQRQRLSLTSSHFAKVYLYVCVADTYRPHLVRCKTTETIILLEATTALRVRSLS